ncbi:Carboxylic ester hydrolase [Mycena venus]|uniref:Carboxylic ester hydrolase n=1 Tax=Mycena venus TaxID=2733690 RepID=A0A8H6XMM9_9AGAR|nr:Carboxylic ester hydrolase [Mycena venus]
MGLSLLHAALTFLVGIRTVQAESTSVVDLGYAKYQGTTDGDLKIASFQGIRYAAPPADKRLSHARTPTVFNNRLTTRVYLEHRPGIHSLSWMMISLKIAYSLAYTLRICTRKNPFRQLSGFTVEGSIFPQPIDRNCLRAWVYIHSYIWGAASDYNGTELVLESGRNVVAVTIQYRLGVFGQQVKDGGALNAGLLDQDFALRWVNKHIRKFGGNPDKVAIWGESAGAGSVIQHIIARDGRTEPQLFRAGITSSTYLPPQYLYNDRIPQAIFNEVASQAGCATGKGEELDCLREIDAALLEEINLSLIVAGFQGTSIFVPVVDGLFLTQSPTKALSQRKLNGDILLSITNSNEGFILVNQTWEYDVTEYAQNLFPLLGFKQSKVIASAYQSLGTPLEQVTAIMGESLFVCPTYLLLEAFPGESYKSVSMQGELAIPPGYHGDDLYYYFPSYTAFPFPRPKTYNNTAFINAFNQGFLSFAANLDPNSKLRPSTTPHWRMWSKATDLNVEMVFNRTEEGEPWIEERPSPYALLNRCELWKSLHELTGQ